MSSRSNLTRRQWLLVLVAGLFLTVLRPALAAPADETRPFLSPIFGDNMVLQRDKPNTFWGWTKPGESVRVEINGRATQAVADASGRWQASVQPPKLGEECTVIVSGAQRIQLQHVIVGDVWLCGGQSNMGYGLPGVRDGAREVATADHPNIRIFTVATHSAYAPTDMLKGTWKVCTPQSVAAEGGFSAVAYFFARRVQQETGVPIGLIQDCLGGTPAETWMSPATLVTEGEFAEPMAEIARLREEHAPEYGNYIMHWYDRYDPGIKEKSWFAPDLDDHDWKAVPVPGAFGELGLADVPALVWFRKEITLPDPVPAGDAIIHLGVVEKMETTYVNGKWVGASSWVENPRAYRVPHDILKPGRNLVTVRVLKVTSKTGFMSPPEKFDLSFTGGPVVPLAGDWRARVAVDARPPHPLPLGYENYPIMPAVLYQGMLAPVAPLAITGALWYQGEANASRAHQYRTLLPAMIKDWRRLFQQGDFPFLIVSLPVFGSRKAQPGSDDWAELREAQALTAAAVPNCGLAITIDTGDPENLHPKDKLAVGERLALIALAQQYGRDVVFSGPTYRSMERAGSALRIHFDHLAGGLKVQGDKLAEFSVAGSDRKWHWATAAIEGDTVVVSAPEVSEPVAVRYAWQSNPQATLFNAAGLQAAPFRSDNWPGVTDHHKPW